MVTCGGEPGEGLAAKWVSVSIGYMWRGAWGGPGCQVGVSNSYMWRGAQDGAGCQVGKCQQWLHVEGSLGRAWLPSG